MLGEDDRRELLRIARSAVREHLRSGKLPPGVPHQEALLQPRGVFVTLHGTDERGERTLRGCIGTIGPQKPLYRAVQEMAAAAATRDPRFDPVEADELARIDFEISVLGEPRAVAPGEVVVGEHGLCVSAGGARGLLLPQVPVEHGWHREEFLAHTCRKAGLSDDAWRDPATRIEAFTAEVFGEGARRP